MQIAWLLNQFEALQGPSGHDWTIDVGPGVTDVVGVADGTDDLASMPRQLLDGAAEWLGGPPQYRLALTIGDSPACRDLAWRIAEEFAGRTTVLWPPTAARLGALLEEQAHGWPERLPAHSWCTPRTAYTRVRPEAVVEVCADLAIDGLRWRHPVRFGAPPRPPSARPSRRRIRGRRR